MRRKTLIMAMLVLFVLFSGCGEQNTSGSEISQDAASSNIPFESIGDSAGQENSRQYLTNDKISNPNLYKDDWMTIDIPEVGLKNLTFGGRAEGRFTKDSIRLRPAYIFRSHNPPRYSNSFMHDSYLAVVLESEILFKDLENISYGDILYVCNIDGDSLDEIIVQQIVGMSGGAGSYSSRIFKVVGDEIQEIFNSVILNPSGGWSIFDTGFASEFLNEYKLKITNSITGYSTVIDISERYIDEFFDENGMGKRNVSIWCDSFMKFYPEDADGDGSFEIVCLQYVSLDSHPDYIGDAKSILKFNPQTQEFEVIQTEFISAE